MCRCISNLIGRSLLHAPPDQFVKLNSIFNLGNENFFKELKSWHPLYDRVFAITMIDSSLLKYSRETQYLNNDPPGKIRKISMESVTNEKYNLVNLL